MNPESTEGNQPELEETTESAAPSYDFRDFTVHALTTDLRFETKQSYTRREAHPDQPYPAAAFNKLNEGEKSFWAKTPEGQAFAQSQDAKDYEKALLEWQEQQEKPWREAYEQYQQDHAQWEQTPPEQRGTEPVRPPFPHGKPTTPAGYEYPLREVTEAKIGLKGWEIARDEDNNLVVRADIFPARAYHYYGLNRQVDKELAATWTPILANAAFEITADGMCVLQDRDPQWNLSFPETLGAGIAGTADQPFYSKEERAADPSLRATLKPVTTEDLKGQLLTETWQETKQKPEEFKSIHLVALIEEKKGDKKRGGVKHFECAWVMESNLTAAEIAHNAATRITETDASSKHFKEQILFLPATSEALERILTESLCPIPGTHEGVDIAGLHYIIVKEQLQKLEQEGISGPEAEKKANKTADDEIQRLQPLVNANLDLRDRTVMQYYDKNRDQIPQKHESFLASLLVDYDWENDKSADESQSGLLAEHFRYDASIRSSKQGLPTPREELERLGYNQPS